MILVIFAVFGICLFPVWPFEAKVIIFYVSVVMLYLMIGLIAIRILWFIVWRIFGIDSWILPNLFEVVLYLFILNNY